MDYLSSLLCQATRLAAQAHDGAFRKGGNAPYLLHPIEVTSIVATMSEDEDVLAAAMLHDVLEDTDVTAQQLRESVGSRVESMVSALSENKRPDRPAAETWRERKQEALDAMLKEQRTEVKQIALGDKLSNMRTIARDYALLGDELWKRFNNPNRNEQGWYYQGMVDALQDLNFYPAWHELANLVWEVFWQDRDRDQLQLDMTEKGAAAYARERELGLEFE